jgi:hypothetical protein
MTAPTGRERQEWGWRLVVGLIVVACLPKVGLAWTKALSLQVFITAWAWCWLWVGHRTIEWGMRRSLSLRQL